MDRPFPFCYPAPTAFYLIAYMVTLLVHLVFMQYVLAGSAYLVFGRFLNRAISFRRKQKAASDATEDAPDPIHETLRDWLPFATSAAITAGVAPLLFLQILYRKSFYTANLLLFHRWMAIVPVLIVGFYLLYLLKTDRIRRGPAWRESAVALAALACFGFTAWSWSENHLLSLDFRSWPAIYKKGELFHHTDGAGVRTAGWFLLSFPTMLLLVAFQNRSSPSYWLAGSNRVSLTLTAVSLFAVFYGAPLPLLSFSPNRLGESDAWRIRGTDMYEWVAIVAMGLLIIALLIQSRRELLNRPALYLASLGQCFLLCSIVLKREQNRVMQIDMRDPIQAHADAFRIAGLPLFLLFLFVNAVLVAWCIRIARRARDGTNTR